MSVLTGVQAVAAAAGLTRRPGRERVCGVFAASSSSRFSR